MVVLAVLVILSPAAITDVFTLLQMSWDMVDVHHSLHIVMVIDPPLDLVI